MNLNLAKVLKFTTFLNKFRDIERSILIKNSNRKENDAEHSYQLAMLAWYINEVGKLNHNPHKILRYALIHDLVEIYAGDTDVFSKNPAEHETKEDRELKALKTIEKEFLEFPELSESIKTYNQKIDSESKFVYVLDKLIPVLNLYLEGGNVWKTQKISLEMLLENKTSKIKMDPDLNKIFEDLVIILKDNEAELFGKA